MLPDETIENQEQVVGEETTEQQTEETVVESTAEQVQDDPLRLSEAQQSRYKSAADLEAFAATKQSEADRLRSEFETYKQQHPAESAQPNTPTGEEQLEQFARDPVAFVQNVTNDIRAQVALSEFARTHPDIEQYKAGMREVVNRTPGILADPQQGLEMAYLLVKNQSDATKATQAATIKAEHNAQVQATKKIDAVVEGATVAQPQASTKIDPNDSPAEMDRKMDAAGIPWVTDEERHRPDDD
jgi:hypothetical protein